MTNTSFQVKKFIADDIAKAFQMVKNEFGQEAVILSNETIDGKVHILAAPQEQSMKQENKPFQEHANQTATALLQLKREKAQKIPEVSSYHYPNMSNAKSPKKFSETVLSTSRSTLGEGVDLEPDTMHDLKAEMMSIRKMMSANFASQCWEHYQQENINQSIIYKKLLSIGFEPNIVDELVHAVSSEIHFDEAWVMVLNALVQKVNLYKNNRVSRRINLTMGPSGCGKTTLLAKHLMEHITEENAHQYGIIFVNQNKLTTVHEAQTFQNIFNVSCYYVESLDELEKAYAFCDDKKKVFIDLPSIDLINPENNFFLEFVQRQVDSSALFLVLPSNTNADYLKMMDSSIRGLTLSAVSITKIDEYENYAPIINYVIERNIPVAYLNINPELTEPLIHAQCASIMSDILVFLNKQNLNHSAIDEKMANHLMERTTNEPESEEKPRQSA